MVPMKVTIYVTYCLKLEIGTELCYLLRISEVAKVGYFSTKYLEFSFIDSTIYSNSSTSWIEQDYYHYYFLIHYLIPFFSSKIIPSNCQRGIGNSQQTHTRAQKNTLGG